MIPELNTRKAELALLGAIINGGRITDITPSDFEAKDTQEIYSAIQLMQSERRKIDTVTLDAETGSKYTETIVDAEGIGFLTYHDPPVCQDRQRKLSQAQGHGNLKKPDG